MGKTTRLHVQVENFPLLCISFRPIARARVQHPRARHVRTEWTAGAPDASVLRGVSRR
jgi:hypothetical protein